MAHRLLLVLVAVLLGGAPIGTLAEHEPPDGIPRSAQAATVRAIVDGDTIRVTLEDGTKDTVRLIGIDTPETKDPNSPVECFGQEASDRIAKLLPIGRAIWLEPDQTNRDRYDRLLRYAWVQKKSGGVYLVNEVMVRDGFAIAKRYPPDTKRARQLEHAQDRAMTAGKGLWSACPAFLPTPTPEPTQPPVVVQPTPAPIGIGGNCDPSYPTLCIPIGSPDLDCGDIAARRFPVYQPDPMRFDGDYDGIGCESG